jgi:hypothetical protein
MQHVFVVNVEVPGREHGFGSEAMDRRFVQRLCELGWVEGRNVAESAALRDFEPPHVGSGFRLEPSRAVLRTTALALLSGHGRIVMSQKRSCRLSPSPHRDLTHSARSDLRALTR